MGARLDRGLAGACALVLALCVTHQLLMPTERHAGALQGHVAFAPMETATGARLDAAELGGQRMPQAPRTILGDCPAQHAILPLLLLALLGVLRGTGPVPWDAAHTRGRAPDLRPLPAPPLAPARRRALLQVFLN